MDSCDSCKFIECVCRHRMDDYYRGIPDLCFSHECVDHVFRHKKEKDMIPQFPQFKRVEITDREAVEAHTHKYEPYSDFNFTSLWAWDTSGERMISELNNNLVVRFTDYSTHEPFLSFLGANENEHTARTLIDYCKTEGLPTTLKLVPEVSVKEMRPSVMRVEEDRDNFDYIYSVPKLAAMRGSEYI